MKIENAAGSAEFRQTGKREEANGCRIHAAVSLLSIFQFFTLLLGAVLLTACKKSEAPDDFTKLTNTGRNYYEQGQLDKAVAALEKAAQLRPEHPDTHLNLANAYLRANQPEKALARAQEALKLDRNSGAGHFLSGCALLRLGQAAEALKALQQAKDIDRTVNAVSFQLGRAHQQVGNFEDAAAQFQEVVQFEPNHPAAHYNLSQVLLRLGRNEAAQQALAQHQQITAGKGGQITDPAVFEKCQYTQIQAPFQLEQPDPTGIAVTFADATTAAFGNAAAQYSGPVGVIDLEHDGRHSIFVIESNAFRLLLNSNGVFQPHESSMPVTPDSKYSRTLVADLNNDRYDDVVMLGSKGSHVFRLATNGGITDVSRFSRATQFSAEDGLLADIDFSAKLDLVVIRPGTNDVRVLRNLGNPQLQGNPYFTDGTTNSGVPMALTGARRLLAEDWDGDELDDLIITREAQPPLVLIKQRGGPFAETNANLPSGTIIASGDLNNDLRHDLAIVSGSEIVCVFNGLIERRAIPIGASKAVALHTIDYDNDGWLDLVLVGDGVRIWRNAGKAGFQDKTAALGLDKLKLSAISVAAADFDRDGDTDLLLARDGGGLQLLSNQGGSANGQIKLHLVGHKANASGIGVRVGVASGGIRLSRRVGTLPVEIGVGPREELEALTAHFVANVNYADFKVEPRTVVTIDELTIPEGSCPYLYAWDGKRFRFVTDLLGAAPAGLPVAEGRYIESDPEEFVWIGNEQLFAPRDGQYVVQISEELREVLYLDEAKLVVVDHPPDTEVHPTSKLLPGKPFRPHELVTLQNRRSLVRATNHLGTDVTELLQSVDHRRVSPTKLRPPQLRGLAEPHSVTLDFGPLPVEKALVLALTGWLRFGGGTANVAASHDPTLPFPFPVLEAELPNGQWQPVPVVAGAPAGKTKTILIDIAGKLPSGSRRLRLGAAFEIHWDRIALFEKRDNADTRITYLAPDTADLHWRGFSEYQDLPWHFPLTPDYDRVYSKAKWTITPAGWCTRYGDVSELIARRDNGLALLNGGDELTLTFDAKRLPEMPNGFNRNFFLWSVGWDKDADFHCARGAEVEPLPWHGMDDQLYGREPRPEFPTDAIMRRYNTRWVGPYTLTRKN
ncbi:MAG: FG-GAP-like repeat-containing protein [Verrucomicrobia subdivision 3 bacterium]|nr:FG-GAP-like repeat-containing protein [Limisphaerales bacterium]